MQVLDTSSTHYYLEQARTLLSALESQITAQEATQIKQRPKESDRLLFRVGQVIHHIRHSYRGVIYGWDTFCSATPEYPLSLYSWAFLSNWRSLLPIFGCRWIREMRVDELPRGRDQPFYAVLVDIRDKPGNWTTYGMSCEYGCSILSCTSF